MENATLLLDALLLVATGFVYGVVGRVVMRRPLRGDARTASTLFGVWWFALAALQLVYAAMRVLGWAGLTDVALFATFVHLEWLALSIALWGLLYYLLYIFTGRSSLLWPTTAFYLAYYVGVVYLIAVAEPTGVVVGAWTVTLQYANEPTPVAASLVVLLLLVPILGGAIGYARLYFHAEGATQRYRIGLVSVTILVWFGSALVVQLLGNSGDDWWRVVNRLIGLAAAGLVYAAYRPPAWVRARYDIHAADDAPPAA